ncbi:unnamed protein product, partial [Citrullus colocynthis]
TWPEGAKEVEGVGEVEAGREGSKTLKIKTWQIRTPRSQTLLHLKTQLVQGTSIGR